MSRHAKQAEIFRGLVEPYTKTLYRAAWRLTGTPEDAEDLVQELLVRLYPKTKEMQKIEKLLPWLKKALYRLFIDEKRKHARRPRGHTGPPDTDTEEIPANNPDPDRREKRI